MKYDLTYCGVTVNIENGKGTATTGVERATCPSCGEVDCFFSCEGSNSDDNDELEARIMFNSSIDAVENMIVAHAIHGVDITSSAYQRGVLATLKAICSY